MKTAVAFTLLSLLLVPVTMPASANHDQGQGKSQDHLHRGGAGSDGAVQVAQVPEPGSGLLLTIGGGLFVGATAIRALAKKRRASTNG